MDAALRPRSAPAPTPPGVRGVGPSVEARAAALRRFGAAPADLEALLDYTEDPFDSGGALTLDDEPSVAVWEEYAAEAAAEGAVPVLRRALVQLRFPVRAGMSEEPAYRAATRRGDLAALGLSGRFEGGLGLEAPDRIRVEVHPTPAGRVPVITAPARADFVALVRALARRNEPAEVPDSMGALMVGGYNNWDRVGRYRRAWAAGRSGGTWAEAFRRLVPRKELYQDRFILLSEGPYSGLPAAAVGLEASDWVAVSHRIRLEHECAHYYCRRALGAMRHHVIDEVIADAYGLAAGAGGYDAARLLAFLAGVPGGPPGRIGNYLDGLAPTARPVVERIVREVAGGLEADPELRAGLGPDPCVRAAALRRIVAAAVRGWVGGE